MAKIVQVAVATSADSQSGATIIKVLCVDADGRAWELRGSVDQKTAKWIVLPPLPNFNTPEGRS